MIQSELHGDVQSQAETTWPAARRVTKLIYQGADYEAMFLAMEYKAGTTGAWWPYGTLGLMGIIGRLRYSLSAALVMTAIAGTPAAASPATLTASHALMSANFPTQLLFGPTLRKLPMQMDLFPYDTGGAAIGWYQ
jgi:hypothetical protein